MTIRGLFVTTAILVGCSPGAMQTGMNDPGLGQGHGDGGGSSGFRDGPAGLLPDAEAPAAQSVAPADLREGQLDASVQADGPAGDGRPQEVRAPDARGSLEADVRLAIDAPAPDAFSPVVEVGPEGGTMDTQCHALRNTGPPVRMERATGQQTLPQGGALADGTYLLTKRTTTGDLPDENVPARITLRVSERGTTLEWISDRDGEDDRRTYRLLSAGTVLSLSRICPEPARPPSPFGYTATPTQLLIFGDAGEVSTYSRVP